MKKTGILRTKPVFLGLSILELSKISMYKFWYDCVKPKYDEKAKLYNIDTDSFVVYIKRDDVYKDVAEDVETRFDTSNYEVECNSTERKNGLRAKTYSYVIDDSSEDKKAKGTKKCAIKRKLKFENYKNCLEATQLYFWHI